MVPRARVMCWPWDVASTILWSFQGDNCIPLPFSPLSKVDLAKKEQGHITYITSTNLTVLIQLYGEKSSVLLHTPWPLFY